MADRPIISVEGLAKTFPGVRGNASTTVFNDVYFGIGEGEFVCLIGHSGCGKTTLLNILAGLDRPSAGGVVVEGAEVIGPSLDRAVIFQGHALMPWLTVMGNIAFAARSRYPNKSKSEITAHCQKYIDLVHLTGRTHPEINAELNRKVGVKRISIATLRQLERRLELARTMLRGR